MDTAELDAALIRELAQIDAICIHLERVTYRLWGVLGDEIGRWAKSNDWLGDFDPDTGFSAWPKRWASGGEKPEHCFSFDNAPGDEQLGLSQDLSRWCGAGGGRIALFFVPSLGRRKWKPVATAARVRLADKGFYLDDAGDAYSECTPQIADVEAGFREGDLTSVAKPLRMALDRAAAALPLFDQLLKQADS